MKTQTTKQFLPKSHSLFSFVSGTVIVLTLLSPIYPVFAEESDTPDSPSSTPVPTEEPAPTEVDTTPIDSAIEETTPPSEEHLESEENNTNPPPSVLEEDTVSSPFTEGGESHFNDQRNSVSAQLRLLPDPQSGAVTYSYPIDVPPGRGNMTPQIALSYSSGDTNNSNQFGYGWSVNIPFIQRYPKYGVPQMYTATSSFYSSIDGELILISTTTSTSTYGPKVENGSFNKYELKNSTYWLVTSKDGTTYKFGYSTSSRQDDLNSSSRVFKWMLEDQRDTNNNYISYQYFKDRGQIYASTTKYTGNNVTDGPFTIDFYRELRSDISTSTQTGFASSTVTRYRINEIRTNINGTWVKKYTLGYSAGSNTKRSLLSTILLTGQTETGGTTLSVPTTTFGYQSVGTTTKWDLNSNYTIPIWFTSTFYDEASILEDVNGDGLPDITRSLADHFSTTTDRHVYINKGDGTGWAEDTNYVIPVDFMSSQYDQGVRMGDVNGDGFPDLLKSVVGCGGGDDRYVYINKANGTGWVLDSNYTGTIPVTFTCNNHDNGVRIFDVNGDGLVDIIQDYTDGSGSRDKHVYINKGNGTGWAEDTNYSTPDSRMPAPFSSAGSDLGTRIADINGDGLPDLIRAWNDGGGTIYRGVYLNNGDGTGWTEDTGYTIPTYFIVAGNDNGARILDVNGDGLADIVYNWTDGAGHVEKHVYINKGDGTGWAEDSSYVTPAQNLPEIYISNNQDVGTRNADIDGDGMTDFIRSWKDSSSTSTNQTVYISKIQKADLLSTTTDSRGFFSEVSYQGSPQYKNGSGQKQNPHLPVVLMTLKQTSVGDGLSSTTTTNYTYGGGGFFYGDPFNHRISGFATVTASDQIGQTTTFYHQASSTDTAHGAYSDDEWKIGKPYRVEKSDNSGNLYAKTINKWVDTDLGGGRRFVNLAQSVNSNYDGNSTHRDTAIKNTFESTYGNLQQTINYGEVTGSDDGAFSDTGSDIASTTIGYAASTTLYIVGLPATEVTQNQSSVKLRETNHYYDSLSSGNVSKGNETKTENWATTTTYASTTRTFDSTYGLVTQSRDPLGNITTYTIDGRNLYPATTTNALSQETGYTYDYATGKVKNIFDANSRLYTTTYDALRRPLVVSIPDPSSGSLVTKTAYTYTDSATPGSTIIQQTDYLNSATSSNTYTYFDGFGRKLQERKPADGINTFAVVDYAYNNFGLIASTTLPYFSSSTARTTATTSAKIYTQLTYDPLQRVTQIVNAVGTTTNTYDDWRTRTTDANGKNKDFWKDAYGNLANVVEYLNGSPATTTYAYDTVNNLTKITDALSNLRNFIYDGLARRIWSEDLHASGDTLFGTSTYTYDVANNLTQFKDPRASTTNYTYDTLNRKLTEDNTSGGGTEITYVYDTCLNGKGKLCSATTTNNGIVISTGRVYNPLGLTATETKYINGQWYNTSYTFDRQANQSKITYPDNSEVRYTYATSSKPIRIEQRETSGSSWRNIVANVTYSPMGQETSIYWGSQATTTYTYDQNALYRLINILTLAPTAGTGGNALAMAMAGKGWTSSFALAPSLQKLALAKADQLSELLAPEPSLTEELFGDAILFAKPHTSTGTPDLNAKPHIEEISDQEYFSVAFASQVKNAGAEGVVIKKDKPEVRLKKWNDEVNVGISYDGVATTGVKVANADKVEWKGNSQSVEVYPLDAKEGMEDGGLEMEVVLNAIPTSNVFSFKVDGADDLDFFYQSPMNELDHSNDSRIASCTEDACADKEGNVVESYLPGVLKSYAVYHKTKRNYELGGLNYATGKVFQIFRPKAVDADGNETWAELSYASGTLSVTVPQGFLKKATYPVRVDPTFGYTTVGGSGGTFSTDEGAVNKYVLGSACKVIKLTSYQNTASGNLKGLIYSNSGTEPAALQGATPSTASGTGWIDATFSSPVSLSSGGTYWIGIVYSNSNQYAYDNIGTRRFDFGLGFTTPTDPWDTAGDGADSRQHSVYATCSTVPQTLQNMSYTYDAMGNITTITDYSDTGAGKIANFTYDDLNRLLTASTTQASSTSYRYQYAYDLLGSITGSKLNSSATTSYTYAGILYANPHAPTKIGSTVLGYDNAGNATSSGSTVYAWDWRNRLSTSTVSGTTRIYSYDENDDRMRLDDGTTIYHYPNPLYQTDSVSALPTKHILLNGKDIATIEGATGSGTVTFRYPDHLGSVNVATDNTNTVLQTLDYYPYGSRRINSGTDVSQREYIGQFYDEGPGLSYLNARYYNGTQGQFLSQDPVFLGTQQNLQDPQSLNSYSYANGNPIVNKDPSGRCPTCLFGAGAGILGQYAVDVYNNSQANGFNLNAFVPSSSGSTYLTRAAQGFAIGLTGGLVGATGLGLLSQSAIVGVASGATGAVGNSVLGDDVTAGSVAIDTILGAATFGASEFAPGVRGALPKFGTKAFYSGAHTIQNGLKVGVDGTSNYLGQTLTGILNSPMSRTLNYTAVSAPAGFVAPKTFTTPSGAVVDWSTGKSVSGPNSSKSYWK